MKFTDDQLRAYIAALGEKYGFEVTISERAVHQDYTFLEFHGRMPRMRLEHKFVIPIENRIPGVITARSVLVNTGRENMSWLLNGQASRNCREIVFIGASSDNIRSLHASKDMLKAWTHQNLPNIPDERKDAAERAFNDNYEHHLAFGCYGDDVSIADYVNDPNNTAMLTLRLTRVPKANQPESDEPEPSGPQM